MVLPLASASTISGVQSIFDEPEAHVVFPSAELAGGGAWKAGCTRT